VWKCGISSMLAIPLERLEVIGEEYPPIQDVQLPLESRFIIDRSHECRCETGSHHALKGATMACLKLRRCSCGEGCIALGLHGREVEAPDAVVGFTCFGTFGAIVEEQEDCARNGSAIDSEDSLSFGICSLVLEFIGCHDQVGNGLGAIYLDPAVDVVALGDSVEDNAGYDPETIQRPPLSAKKRSD